MTEPTWLASITLIPRLARQHRVVTRLHSRNLSRVSRVNVACELLVSTHNIVYTPRREDPKKCHPQRRSHQHPRQSEQEIAANSRCSSKSAISNYCLAYWLSRS